jgi:hypothetical protein
LSPDKQQPTERFSTVATFAAAMNLQHAPKAVLYGMAGFAFFDWLGLLGMMIAAGALGTWIGLHLLKRLSNRRFDQVFRLLLTLLAARLVWNALTAQKGGKGRGVRVLSMHAGKPEGRLCMRTLFCET